GYRDGRGGDPHDDASLRVPLGDSPALPDQARASGGEADPQGGFLAGQLHLPVLWQAVEGADHRPCGASSPWWTAPLGEPGQRLQALQPPEGREADGGGADVPATGAAPATCEPVLL